LQNASFFCGVLVVGLLVAPTAAASQSHLHAYFLLNKKTIKVYLDKFLPKYF